MQSYLFITLILASGLLADEPPSQDKKFTESKIRQTITDRCSKYSNATVATDFYDVALPTAGECFQKAERERNCTELFEGTKECGLQLLNKLKPCMNAEENYFPELISKLYGTGFEKHCKGEIGAWKTEQETANCNFPYSNGIFETCFVEVNFYKRIDDLDFVYTKAEICSDSKTLVKCVTDNLKSGCTNPEKLIEIVTTAYTEYTKPCNDVAEN